MRRAPSPDWGLLPQADRSANALTSPSSSGVQRHGMVTVSPGGTGTIEHVIDGTGATVDSGSTVAGLTSYS